MSEMPTADIYYKHDRCVGCKWEGELELVIHPMRNLSSFELPRLICSTTLMELKPAGVNHREMSDGSLV